MKWVSCNSPGNSEGTQWGRGHVLDFNWISSPLPLLVYVESSFNQNTWYIIEIGNSPSMENP